MWYRLALVLCLCAFGPSAKAWFIIFPVPNFSKPDRLQKEISALESLQGVRAMAIVAEDKLFGSRYWVWGSHIGGTQAEAEQAALRKCEKSLSDLKSQVIAGKSMYDFGDKKCELYQLANTNREPAVQSVMAAPKSSSVLSNTSVEKELSRDALGRLHQEGLLTKEEYAKKLDLLPENIVADSSEQKTTPPSTHRVASGANVWFELGFKRTPQNEKTAADLPAPEAFVQMSGAERQYILGIARQCLDAVPFGVYRATERGGLTYWLNCKTESQFFKCVEKTGCGMNRMEFEAGSVSRKLLALDLKRSDENHPPGGVGNKSVLTSESSLIYKSTAERIRALDALLKDGLISANEYKQKRKEILDKF